MPRSAFGAAAPRRNSPDSENLRHGRATTLEIGDTLAGAPSAPHAQARAMRQAARALLLSCTVTLFCLHFVHLTADFPNHSPWMDWSKYTDEGWYGDAAIRHYLLGHWYVPGDFNPAAALPVWPFLEGLVFHFTGVSVVAARALTVSVFGAILLSSWSLLRRSASPGSLAPEAAVLLLAASPFCFVFTRLAILEPLLVLLTLLALLTATGLREGKQLRTVLLLGLIFPAMVLTKTTAIFLFPAVLWMLFAHTQYQLGSFVRIVFPASAIAAATWLLWFSFVVRHGFLLDYRYLFSANAYTGITLANAFSVLQNTVRDGLWIGDRLFPSAEIAAVLTLLFVRRLRSRPLALTLVIWAAGYIAFLAYHDNLQPRYYLVTAVPLTLLVPVVLDLFFSGQLPWAPRTQPLRTLSLVACSALILAIALPDTLQTLAFIRKPEHTLLTAAGQVKRHIAGDRLKNPDQSPLVLSISGSDLSLMTGLPSICDDFGTLELADRIKKYRPGWYVAWNQIDDDKMDALTPLYHPVRVAAFPAMDDPDRNLLILYRLDPADETSPRKRLRKPIPRLLQTDVGQQPSTAQLVH